MEHTEGQGMWGVTFSTLASSAGECVLPRGFFPFQTISVLFFSKNEKDERRLRVQTLLRRTSRVSLLEACGHG